MTFKETWEKVDETCPSCGQITKRVRGITRQNVKRLFRINFNVNEFLVTFMLIMILILAFAYKSEVKASQEWIKDMNSGDLRYCKSVCNSRCEIYFSQGFKGNNSQNYTAFAFNTSSIIFNE